jgi:hypothetical protein
MLLDPQYVLARFAQSAGEVPAFARPFFAREEDAIATDPGLRSNRPHRLRESLDIGRPRRHLTGAKGSLLELSVPYGLHRARYIHGDIIRLRIPVD